MFLSLSGTDDFIAHVRQIRAAVEQREAFKSHDEDVSAEQIKRDLEDIGVTVFDTPDGPMWKWNGVER